MIYFGSRNQSFYYPWSISFFSRFFSILDLQSVFSFSVVFFRCNKTVTVFVVCRMPLSLLLSSGSGYLASKLAIHKKKNWLFFEFQVDEVGNTTHTFWLWLPVAVWIRLMLHQKPLSGLLPPYLGVTNHPTMNWISLAIRSSMFCSVFSIIILRFAGQFLCSYSTLPLYALVTQVSENVMTRILFFRYAKKKTFEGSS